MSVTFSDGRRRRTCFPDLIVWRSDVLWVGELKSAFSRVDYEKVCTLLSLGSEPLREFIDARHPQCRDRSIRGILCHSDDRAGAVAEVYQLVFARDGSSKCVPPLAG